jgi:hypothetical protein
VSDRRSRSGKLVIAATIASRTASAPWPASASPFLARGLPVANQRQVQQHRKPSAALDEHADREGAQADDQIAVPVTGP